MTTITRLFLAGLLAVAGLAAALAVVLLATDSGRSDERSSAEATRPDATAEGIRVHGDWVIEVRNPDGSIAERREFENSLTGFGANLLTLILDRTAWTGAWGVELSSGGSPSPCLETGGSTACIVRENIGGLLQTLPGSHFTTLTVSTQSSPSRFVLQGNFDAQADGVVSDVKSVGCFGIGGSPDPAQCNNANYFTATTLANPVNVTAGQQVLVRVEISFV